MRKDRYFKGELSWLTLGDLEKIAQDMRLAYEGWDNVPSRVSKNVSLTPGPGALRSSSVGYVQHKERVTTNVRSSDWQHPTASSSSNARDWSSGQHQTSWTRANNWSDTSWSATTWSDTPTAPPWHNRSWQVAPPMTPPERPYQGQTWQPKASEQPRPWEAPGYLHRLQRGAPIASSSETRAYSPTRPQRWRPRTSEEPPESSQPKAPPFSAFPRSTGDVREKDKRQR